MGQWAIDLFQESHGRIPRPSGDHSRGAEAETDLNGPGAGKSIAMLVLAIPPPWRTLASPLDRTFRMDPNSNFNSQHFQVK